ncbi:MAG TPA: hypothetical protein VG407_01940 [Caulobacteraceae bacterium]|jgi:hypothetical protein|nr:hypothetical protein [Caulobacteraceae bacterium]
MGEKLGRRLAAMAGAFLCAAVLTAGASWAQPSFTEGSWATDDGGAVSIDKSGVFNIAFTDPQTHDNIFSTGKLVSKAPTADGKLELTLKPASPVPGGITEWVVDVGADGNGELFAVANGQRRRESALTK